MTKNQSLDCILPDPNSAKDLEQRLKDRENDLDELVGFALENTPPPVQRHNFGQFERNSWADKLKPIRVDEIPDDVNADTTARTLLAGRRPLYYGPAIFAGEEKLILISRAGSPAPASNVVEALLAAAVADVGRLSTVGIKGTENGRLGCAAAVTAILHDELHLNIAKALSTDVLYDELKNAGWKEVSTDTPGAVIISPTQGGQHGHTGIIGENGVIYSNNSDNGTWGDKFTVESWRAYYENHLKLHTYAFLPPTADAVGANGPSPKLKTPSKAPSIIGQTIDGVQITRYGYRGDATPDANSLAGIGDRDNKLVPWLSVALTQSQRQALFGVSGKSTGKEFNFAGFTFRDDDSPSAQLKNRRIDVYDPSSTARN